MTSFDYKNRYFLIVTKNRLKDLFYEIFLELLQIF